jgi:flavin reductase (DIM6/NTAB) family NADH-FMN oxidoreductase RutF
MQFDFETMRAMDCFEFLTGTVVPRPIALITTFSADGKTNAAPYSFFNIMGIDPPVVALTVLQAADGRMKDTGNNIVATGEFVANLVSEEMVDAMNVTCIDAPPGVDELAIAKLESRPSTKIKPPRIASSPVAFECRLHTSVPLSANQMIVIGRIVQAHVADAYVLDAARNLFDTPGLCLIGAMHAAKWYAKTSDRFAMERPTWAQWVKEGKV